MIISQSRNLSRRIITNFISCCVYNVRCIITCRPLRMQEEWIIFIRYYKYNLRKIIYMWLLDKSHIRIAVIRKSVKNLVSISASDRVYNLCLLAFFFFLSLFLLNIHFFVKRKLRQYCREINRRYLVTSNCPDFSSAMRIG